MESKGRLVDANRNIFSNKWRITFEVDALPEVDTMSDKDLRITAVQWREKRSLNANSYFHVLVGKIATVLGIGLTECKNKIMAEYGQLDIDDSGKLMTIIMKDDIEWESIEWLHLKPTPKTKTLDDNNLYRVYLIIKGSHLYDTKEMSHLIDGAVSEAKELGIETLTPAELSVMLDRWGGEIKNAG